MLRLRNFGLCQDDLYLLGHEQLFTDLTPSEAALIKGGSVLNLKSITCEDANQVDLNQPRLFVNGIEVWSGELEAGQEAQIDRYVNFSGFAAIELYNGGCCRDGDLMGIFIVSGGASDEKQQPLNNESQCRLIYQVFQ